MTEMLLAVLLRQAALLSLAVALLWALRPLLLRTLGAAATYAAWLVLPALLLTPALPRPAHEPLRVVLQAAGGTATAGLPALPTPTTGSAGFWLAAWLAGTALVVGVQARRQWRLSRLGERLPKGSSPALVGLLRPHVALPSDFEARFTPAERELILAHEEVHRARRDNLWNLLGWLLTALHWWNPLAWWAQRRLQADQELACDAAVLQARPGARADYARALLAAHGLRAPAAPLASRWGCVHPLVERIAMLDRLSPLTRRRGIALAALLTCMAGAAYALEAAQAEPPVVEGFLKLRFDLQLSMDGQAIGSPKLVVYPAKPALLAFSDRDKTHQWLVRLEGRFVDEGQLLIESDLRLNEDVDSIRAWEARKPTAPPDVLGQHVASPKLLVKEGVPATIDVTTADGKHRLAVNLRVQSFRSAAHGG